MTNGCILEIDEYCKKSYLSNIHFADIVHYLSLGKLEFDWCLIKNNVEVWKKEVRKFQRLPTSSRPFSSNSNNYFADQTFIPTSRNDLDKALAEGVKYRKKASYFKRKYEKSSDSANDQSMSSYLSRI